MKYVIIISAGLGAVMLFLLATAGADTGLFDRKYRLLIRLNVGFVLFLMAVVGYLLWRLRRRLKAGVFGSRLALRLLLIFSLKVCASAPANRDPVRCLPSAQGAIFSLTHCRACWNPSFSSL